MTADQVTKMLKEIIRDYNFWGESESDSPLKISRTKLALDPLKIDSRLRKKEELEVPENRIVTTKSLDEAFNPLIENTFNNLKTVFENVTDGNYVELQDSVEALEYYIQLKHTFAQLTNTNVNYVDAENDPYVTLIIEGQSGTETIYGSTLLTQT